MSIKNERRSLLSSNARIQVPWIKIVIGNYTFGVFSKKESASKNENGFYYTDYSVKYPNYVQSLNITKINGQVNQYVLSLKYPVTQTDDPNFFEKVISSVSNTRKILFSYGDMSMPSYIYKNEEAIITKVTSRFQLQGGIIEYTINATSSAALNSSGSFTFNGRKARPSKVIKDMLMDTRYNLRSLFTGMNASNIDYLIAQDDKEVTLYAKRNISPIDYITYLVSCMIPESTTSRNNANSDLYVLTMHDDTTFDDSFVNGERIVGSYFRIKRVSHKVNQSDAFEIDIGFGNSGTIVTDFSVSDDQNYALLYNYNAEQEENQYVQRIDSDGNISDVWAPTITSKNSAYVTRAEDVTWWTQMTKYPIKASITVQGLLRPAMLMNYVRLNVIFVGGRKHVSSGLYMVTQQQDTISGQTGYKTTLQLTKIAGDDSMALDPAEE